jgi:hypothetical protein
MNHIQIDEKAANIASQLNGISIFLAYLVLERVKSYLSQYSVTRTSEMPSDCDDRINFGRSDCGQPE